MMQSSEEYMESTTFGICSDAHAGLIHDAPERIAVFVEDMNARGVDFIIQLGDLAHTDRTEDTAKALTALDRFSGPIYHVIGNHEGDAMSKVEAVDFLHMPSPWYSFDVKGFHFVVLDTNYYLIKKGPDTGKCVGYSYGNYAQAQADGITDTINYLSVEELTWLEQDLIKANGPCFIFSHASLAYYPTKPDNAHPSDAIKTLLTDINKEAGYRKIVACFHGHLHADTLDILDGIYFYQINSISDYWVGKNGRNTSYAGHIHDRYPHMEFMCPYRDPLYAVITLDPKDRLMYVKGSSTVYSGSSPKDVGCDGMQGMGGYFSTPSIQNRVLSFET